MTTPFSQSPTTFMYTIHLTRPAVLTDGPTENETAIVAQHWAYLQELLAQGKLIFAGRTLLATEESCGSAIFRADSEEEARAIKEGDPAVQAGFSRARLYPYQVLLMATDQ